MILTRANRETPIALTLDKRATGLYPQVKIYDIDDNLVDTIDLSEIGGGEYKGTYTPDGTLKVLELRGEVYTDADHSIVSSDYGKPETEVMVIDDSSTEVNQELLLKLLRNPFAKVSPNVVKLYEAGVDPLDPGAASPVEEWELYNDLGEPTLDGPVRYMKRIT